MNHACRPDLSLFIYSYTILRNTHIMTFLIVFFRDIRTYGLLGSATIKWNKWEFKENPITMILHDFFEILMKLKNDFILRLFPFQNAFTRFKRFKIQYSDSYFVYLLIIEYGWNFWLKVSFLSYLHTPQRFFFKSLHAHRRSFLLLNL